MVQLGAMGVLRAAGVGLLVAELLVVAYDAFAQTTAVCSNSPGAGQRIECTQDDTSTDHLVIDAAEVDISTTGQETHGIHGSHQGRGDIHIAVRGGSISTEGTESRAVFGENGEDAVGNITVEIENATIETAGEDARAVGAANRGVGNVNVRIRGSSITTTAEDSWGIQASHAGAGDLLITISAGTEVSTSGNDADGIVAFTSGMVAAPSSIHVIVRDSTVTTSGNSAYGLFVQHGQPRGDGAGPIRITLLNATIVTKGTSSYAVYADQRSLTGAGDVIVTVDGGRLVTERTDDDPNDATDTFAYGIVQAFLDLAFDVALDPRRVVGSQFGHEMICVGDRDDPVTDSELALQRLLGGVVLDAEEFSEVEPGLVDIVVVVLDEAGTLAHLRSANFPSTQPEQAHTIGTGGLRRRLP